MFQPLIFRGTRWFNVSPKERSPIVEGHQLTFEFGVTNHYPNKDRDRRIAMVLNMHQIESSLEIPFFWMFSLLDIATKVFCSIKNSFSCSIEKACYIGCIYKQRQRSESPPGLSSLVISFGGLCTSGGGSVWRSHKPNSTRLKKLACQLKLNGWKMYSLLK